MDSTVAGSTLPRLIQMATQLGEQTPDIPKELERFIPQVSIVHAAKNGLEAASLLLDVPYSQLQNIVNDPFAEEIEIATPYAFRLNVAQLVMTNPALEKLPIDQKVKVLGRLDRFMNQTEGEMFAREEISLNQIPDNIPEIEKWLSGFHPMDVITGGLYQALAILIAAPGTGKTSTMITMMECLKRRYPRTRQLFFEIEIPQQLLLGRMAPLFRRKNPFGSDDRLVTGNVTIEDIAEIVYAWPDDNQIVFVDSPDSMGGLRAVDDSGGRRLELENIYRTLVRIKDKCRLVVVASQPRRGDRHLTQASVAESWAKAWYADLIFGLNLAGPSRLRLEVLKNRFGPPSNSCIYEYDFVNMTYTGVAMEEDDWG